MNIKYLFLAMAFVAQISYACNNNNIKELVTKNHGEVIQVFNSERISPDSSIFFYYSNAADEHPDLKASYVPDRCNPKLKSTFDMFSYDGSAANVESVFWGKGNYKENLFIIVSWVYNLDGVNTVGKYYSVYAYDYTKTSVIKNNKLTNYFESGQDGFVDGKKVKYKFKTAESVWSFLKE